MPWRDMKGGDPLPPTVRQSPAEARNYWRWKKVFQEEGKGTSIMHKSRLIKGSKKIKNKKEEEDKKQEEKNKKQKGPCKSKTVVTPRVVLSDPALQAHGDHMTTYAIICKFMGLWTTEKALQAWIKYH